MIELAIIVAVATIATAIVSVLQLAIAWYTLQEVGDLDLNKTDWWEHRPWRKIAIDGGEEAKSKLQASEVVKYLAWLRSQPKEK